MRCTVIHVFTLTGERDIKELLSFRMKCKNDSCEWMGHFDMLEQHMATCGFTKVLCPNECKDDSGTTQLCMKKYLGSHLEICPNRDYKCQYCGKKGTYAIITQIHDEQCEKKIIPCPNTECTSTTQRGDVQKHLETCRFTEVTCKYQGLGCAVKMARKNMPTHEVESNKHLQMALDEIITVKPKVTTMEEKVDSMEGMIDAKVRRMVGITEERFAKMETTIACMKQRLVNMERTVDNMISAIVLGNGEHFIFRVQEFTLKRDTGAKFTTPSFYTGRNGYQMELDIYTNGMFAKPGVSILVSLVEGKNDKYLNWPFVGEVTVTLLNQLENKHHFKTVVSITSDMNIRAGNANNGCSSQLIPHSELVPSAKKTQYLKDNTLYFKVSVDTPRNKPWLECTTIN